MLKYRVLTGGAFLALVALLYGFAPTWALALVILGLTTLGVLETVHLVTAAGFPALKWTSLAVSLVWMIITWMASGGDPLWVSLRTFMPGVAAWIIFLGCLFRTDQSQSLGKLAGTFLTVAYIPALMQFLLVLLMMGGEGGDGRSLLLWGILVVKSTDMGAYFVGSAIGRRKLIPAISPAKTVEGVLGGVLVAVGVSSLVLWLYQYEVSGFSFRPLDGLIIGLILAGFGILGDLVESMLKRAGGIKDSGQWLKGLGGILDVLDSLVFALPALYMYVSWMPGS
jgi:phosphatidate cytidylyltransferase